MSPDYAMIVECPHCGGTKELLSLMSGNTFSGHQWWDLKEDFPMLPHVSFVQKCPHCGKYFMLKDAKRTEGKDYSFDLGHLEYAKMREAWAQMKDTLQGDTRIQLLLEYVWAYNDAFQREALPQDDESWRKSEEKPLGYNRVPLDDETAEFVSIVRELVAVFPVENKLIHAEFLKEAGLFNEAMAIVEQEGPQEEETYKILERILREKCARKDSSVGIIILP